LSNIWLSYQEGIEKFCDDLAELLRKEGSMVYTELDEPQDVSNPELLLFNEHLSYDPNDDSAEDFLKEMVKDGYKICVNFQAGDAIVGNVAVKIGNKWFAFGRCQKASDGGFYISSMWSLKFVLTNLQKMEIRLSQAFPIST